MSKLLEFLFGSILMALLSVASIVLFLLHSILSIGGIGDCSWQVPVKAWMDSNGDGLMNNDELPLSGVQIHVDDIRSPREDMGWPAITDENGEAQLNVLMLGCSHAVFEVYVTAPHGYLSTTKPRIEVTRDPWKGLDAQSVYRFGFVPER